MSAQFAGIFTSKFISVFLFGALIIILYAKDKFNKPTYDSSAMGPFAQLPPEKLTMDRRYRNGWATYVSMLLAFYTAICIIGPKTFPDLFDVVKALPSQFQAGPQVANADMWPVAAATFLVSTGALSDSSILGRIEYLIRQYAHKTAYIPRTVRDLARYFREIDGYEWLHRAGRSEEVAERRKSLIDYAGQGVVDAVEAAKEEGIVGEALVWVRANILFYILDRKISKETMEMLDGRLDEVKKYPGNESVLQDLRLFHTSLRNKVVNGQGQFLPDQADVAKFLKDVSLLMSVLLSQASRNQVELDGYVRKLGLSEIHFRPPDASAFTTPASIAVLVGAILSAGALYVGILSLPTYFDLTGITTSTVHGDAVNSMDIFPWIAVVVSATLSYVVALRVVTYLRDNALDSLEWRESIAAYVRVVIMAGVISAVISVIAIVLLFALIDKLDYIIKTPPQVAQLIAIQLVLSLIVATFCIYYLRASARLEKKSATLMACMRHGLPLLHAAVAATLVAIIALVTSTYARNQQYSFAALQIDFALDGLLTGQDSINSSLIKAKYPEYDPKAPPSGSDKAKFDKTVTSAKETVMGLKRAIEEAKDGIKKELLWKASEKDGVSSSLSKLASACSDLNEIKLTKPPDAQVRPPRCRNGVAVQENQAAPSANQTTGQPSGPNSRPGGQNTLSPNNSQSSANSTGEQPLAFTLFRHADTCLRYERGTMDCGEEPLLGLGSMLFGAYRSVDQFYYVFSGGRHYAATVVPTLTSFLVAYAFGVGFLFRRAAWLREGLDEPQGIRLSEEIKKNYDVEDIDSKLTIPIRKLGRLTALEALRYEEYSRKLFEMIKAKQVEEFGKQPDISSNTQPSPGAPQADGQPA